MRLYCPDCTDILLIKHKVGLEILSEFDWKSDIITLTNHVISKANKTNALLPTEDVKNFVCRNCRRTYIKDTAHFKCDDCKINFSPNKATSIGQSLIICNKCLNQNTSLEFFKVFGKRSPTKKSRDTRASRIMDESGIEIRTEAANTNEPPIPARWTRAMHNTGGTDPTNV